jgi:hypothetical protein
VKDFYTHGEGIKLNQSDEKLLVVAPDFAIPLRPFRGGRVAPGNLTTCQQKREIFVSTGPHHSFKTQSILPNGFSPSISSPNSQVSLPELQKIA